MSFQVVAVLKQTEVQSHLGLMVNSASVSLAMSSHTAGPWPGAGGHGSALDPGTFSGAKETEVGIQLPRWGRQSWWNERESVTHQAH